MTLARVVRSPLITTLLVAALAFSASFPALFGTSNLALARAALVAFIAIPLLILKYLYKEPSSTYGFCFPAQPLRALGLAALIFIPHALVLFWFAGRTEFKDYYLLVSTGISLASVLLSLAYYTAEEFLFRGFFFFSLRAHGILIAYGANALVFALFHAGKPLLEVGFAAVSALLLCWLSEKTKSFLPAALVHAAIALLLNLLIYLS